MHVPRATAPPRARPPSLPPGPGRPALPALRVSSLVPSLPRRARAATALPAFEPRCRSRLPPEEEVEGAGGARRGGGGGGGKMADFLPSRSVLSVCFPGCVLTSGEAEQQRKSKEIDKCLSREKTYVKRLVKILLLGAGESGKSTFLKQMRIIHGREFDQKALLEFRDTIFENILKVRASPRPHPHTCAQVRAGAAPRAAAPRQGPRTTPLSAPWVGVAPSVQVPAALGPGRAPCLLSAWRPSLLPF